MHHRQFSSTREGIVSFDRKYVICALAYLAVGICLGIFMAASHNHGQFTTHAHINLIGFLLSFGYGIIHKLWLVRPNPTLAKIQFILQQAATVTIIVGLFLLYGQFVPEARLDPFLAVAAISVLVSALLMMYMVVRTDTVKT
jgi:peptidoglycan/LPS O-acetylase OafA/YrhL